VDRTGRDHRCRSAALHRKRVRLRRARGAALLLFVGPAAAIQLVIIISSALALVVVPGLRRAVAPGLLLRLTIGCLAGLPIGLVAFRHADPLLVRGGVGATILAFSALTAASWHRRGYPGSAKYWSPLAMSPGRDLTAGAVSGIATALVGMAGPPVVIYLLLTGITPRTARATLLAYFALCYAATLISHVATIGVPATTWLTAGILIPFAFLGGFAGRRLGDRLGSEAFNILAIALLATTGLYTIAAAAASFAAHQQ
jgi:uncharacterized protein